MYRKSGMVVLVLGALLMYWLVFTDFEAAGRRWVRTEDGGRAKAAIPCPNAWDVLFQDAEPDVRYVFEVESCVKSARGRFVEAGAVVILALVLGIRGILRGPRPPLVHIRPLSEIIGWRERAGPRSRE